MLIHLVHTVAGKMLDGHRHMVFVRAALVGLAEREHFVRVLAVGAHVDDGIAPVEVQIAHWSKSEIAAGGRRFLAGNIPHAIGVLGVIRGPDAQLLAEEGAILQITGGTKFQIGGAEQRDAAVLLHELQRAAHFPGRAGFEQQPAHVILQQFVAQIVFIG